MQGRRRESAGQNARLPPIAPRQDHPQSDAIPSGPINPEVRRNRLPPRSRSGCWTCRTRKVKCDELRPACGQCIRLGHTCDYNPRLAFRDDTQRVLERMQQDVSTSGHTIWDPEATALHRDPRPATEVDDSLPPFSFLTTDEERERKAETRDPGSYYVLVNPDSFASLPEYRDENSPASDSFPPNSGHLQSVFGTIVAEVDDPDIVVLKTFEEPSIPSRKGSGPSSSRLELLSTSPESYTELRRKSQSIVQSYPVHTNTHTVPLLNVSDTGSRDSELLHHYRTVISPLLSKTQDLAGGEDIFEVQAKTYPALYHAMMALSALSMAHKNHIQSADALDALEHYQKVIPALKSTVQSTEDSYSDGAFLSHYILLLYEMATAGNRESNMWQHHSDQLLRIITLRRQAQLEEPYDSIVWSIFVIDVYALLSTTGNGSFVNALRAKNMLPAPERGIDSFPLHRLDARQTEEQPYFPALVQLNQEILLLATHVGQTARKLRSEAQTIFSTPADLSAEAAYFTDCRTKVQELQQMIEDTRSSLKARFPDYWIWLNTVEVLPPRVFSWVHHAYLLLRACILYSHTSMYPGQLRDPAPDFNVQVSRCAKEILHATGMILSQVRREVRFVVLPLFLAGVFTQEEAEKELALNLISAVEPHSYGGCVKAVRALLEAIFRKQRALVLQTGVATSVDWVEEMELSGQRLIISGL